mmetsp:Transcript_40652/g.65237  ORF Transcript_40652/g.65237 Transcript_40652/m.65237 type:complete len:245 (-) Transcript_40652:137-871(-)
MVSTLLQLQLAWWCVLCQEASRPEPSNEPTLRPTYQLYACDFIDSMTNKSNCGACVANSSCTWCTYDESCHLTETYERAHCNASLANGHKQEIEWISGGEQQLFQCCETSTTCEQCTTLFYVECDWCISNQVCFNSTGDVFYECDDGNDDNGKEIVYKDGVCRTDPHETWWDKVKDYWLQIPIVFRCVLATLLSLCLILCCICLCLCCKSNVNKRKLNKKKKKYKRMVINNNSAKQYLAYTEAK